MDFSYVGAPTILVLAGSLIAGLSMRGIQTRVWDGNIPRSNGAV